MNAFSANHLFEAINRRLASCIASYPIHFVLSTLLISAFLSLSLLLSSRFEDDIRRSFSPPRSRASREEKIYNEFYGIASTPQRAFIVFDAIDGGNMLRPECMQEMYKIDGIINSVINEQTQFGERFCQPFCDLNTPLNLFWTGLNNSSSSGLDASETVFDFPVSTLYGEQLFIGGHLFGVQTSDHIFANRSTIIRAEKTVMWYSAQVSVPARRAALRDITVKLFEMSKNWNSTKFVHFRIFGDEIANREMIRGAVQATKLLMIGFFLLLTFVIIIVWLKVEWRKLPSVVFSIIFSPLLAATASFGIISWIQFPIYSIMCVTPFLVLGIGVDDAFLMLHAWKTFDNIESGRERLTKVFVEIGPSISITSITNMVAFGIGYLTPTPQMSLFCLCTSLACFLDYIFTFTLFAPILYMTDSSVNRYKSSLKITDGNKSDHDYLKHYSRLICSWPGRLIAVLVLGLLYVMSVTGVLEMKSTFEPAKAFPSDSPLSATQVSNKLPIFDEFFALQIVVNQPPNISNEIEYAQFKEMIARLETVPYSNGRTLHFLNAYENFDRKLFVLFQMFGLINELDYHPSLHNLQPFLDKLHNPPAIKTAKSGDHAPHLVAFQMTTLARNMSEWSNRAFYVDGCREVLTEYPRFNATVYDGDSAILDLILTAKKDLIGSIAVTILCMAAVCLFFIRSRTGVAVVIFTISSICFTLVGALSWWGADMDPVTMVDVLIATGFSVDYTAHIAYKFCRMDGRKEEKMERCLRELSGPMIQAGISTVLCMLPLVLASTYAIQAFAKTVFLVVALGLVHGLFILPILLIAFSSELPTVILLNRTRAVSRAELGLLQTMKPDAFVASD